MNRCVIRRILLRSVSIALAWTAVLAASGCYQRVVEAEGIGAEPQMTYEPNVEEEVDQIGADDGAGDALKQ